MLGYSQYRNAVASGPSPTTTFLELRTTRRYRVTVLTVSPEYLSTVYGFAALNVSKITVPGAADSTCHVPALSSKITELNGTAAVSQRSL